MRYGFTLYRGTCDIGHVIVKPYGIVYRLQLIRISCKAYSEYAALSAPSFYSCTSRSAVTLSFYVTICISHTGHRGPDVEFAHMGCVTCQRVTLLRA